MRSADTLKSHATAHSGALSRSWHRRATLGQEIAPAQAKPLAPVKRASIYDKSADAKVQVDKAAERAKKNDKRILLMFGGDWCGWCHKLHGLFASNREIARSSSNEYVLVTVDPEAPNAAELLKKCKEALSKDELQKGVGYPFLACSTPTARS